MIIYLLKKVFKILIGDLPQEQKALYWSKFTILLEDVTKAAAKGAVEGAIKNK